jgi:chromosome segregation ATPase
MDSTELRATAKRITLRLARPFSKRVRWRVENLVKSQLAEDVSPRLEDLQSTRQELGQVQKYVPLLLNSISSQNASARDHERRIRALESHLLILDKLADLEPRIARVEDRLDALSERLNDEGT